MAVIGGFRSDLSITRKTDGNPRVFCFPKSRSNEKGGKTSIFFLEASLLGQIFVSRTSNFRGGNYQPEFFDRNTLLFKSVEIRFLTNQRVYFLRASCFLNGRNCNQANVKRCE